jgi:hypothetical protein
LMKHVKDVVLEHERKSKVRAPPRTIEDASHSGRGVCHSVNSNIPESLSIPPLPKDTLYEPQGLDEYMGHPEQHNYVM